MTVVLVEPDGALRGKLAAVLRRAEIDVAPFAQARTAFLFLLGNLDRVDAVLVNEREGSWPRWLRDRLDVLAPAIPVAAYSGDPEQEGWTSRLVPRDPTRCRRGQACG